MADYTTIDDSSAYFQTTLYTGNGGTQSITNTGNSDLQPDWIWIKARNEAEHHNLIDSVRGNTKVVYSSLSGAEDTTSIQVTGFASDGFALGSGTNTNKNNITYAAWQWKETADAGFDIVTYSGSSASSKTVSHNLSAVPKMILVKCRSAGENWAVYHHTLGNTHALFLNTDGASSDTPVFADTTPTSSVFSVNADDRTGANGKTYVAYVFAEKQGYSKFGSYVGNGNANGTFIYTGFKPAFFLQKKSSAAGNYWNMWGYTSASGSNPIGRRLFPNVNAVESNQDGSPMADFCSNGVKLRQTDSDYNGSGATYIYMAFAENPFVTSTGVPATAR